MWFFMTIAVIAIIWLLYLNARNTSETLDVQKSILTEVRTLHAAIREQNERSQAHETGAVAEVSENVAIQKTEPQSALAKASDGNEDPVNINIADLKGLQTLPGIGKAVAQKIIDARPFSSVAELENVSGISQDLYKKLESKITI